MVETFQYLKGLPVNAKVHNTFRKLLPGYGWIPHYWHRLAASHTLYLTQDHFRVEKIGGGGSASFDKKSRMWFSSTRFLAGKLEVEPLPLTTSVR